MKIKVLTDIYPNETVFSWLSRLWIRSGICGPRSFFEEVYGNEGRTYPSLFFIGKLNDEFIDYVKSIVSYKDLLLKHTLFKYYVRFLDLERKQEIYKRALDNENIIENLIPVEMGKKDYFLRYCPACVNEDREKYGEAYFHVEHTFPKVHICVKHKCKLINTKISGINYRFNRFCCLENLVQSLDIIEVDERGVEYKLSKYINDLFKCKLELNKNIKSGDYLTSRLNNKYIKRNYGHRDNALLSKEINEFYKDIVGYRMTPQKLQNILLNKTWNSYELSSIALFENIRPNELASYSKYVDVLEVLEGIHWKDLDIAYTKQFLELASNFSEIEKADLNKKWLCEKFNLKYMILVDHFGNLIRAMSSVKGKKRNWEKLDDEYCERLEELYKNKRELFVGRILTFEYVGSLLNVKDCTLRRFPKLMKKVRILEAQHSIKSNKWISNFIKNNR